MMRSIFLKTLHDRRWFILGWTFGMMALAMLMTSFFPAMQQDNSLDALVENMPAAFQGLVGDLGDLKTFDRYIASQLFDIRVPLIAGVMAIILGLGLGIKEEEDGELRTMLAMPLSRSKVLIEKWLALAAIMAVAAVGLGAGVWLLMPFIEDATIAASDLLSLLAMTWLVMLTFGTVTFAAGKASGHRAVASFIGIFVIIGSFLLSTFAAAVDWLKDYEPLSLLHYFPAVDIVKGEFEAMNIVVLATLTLVSFFVSLIVFRRRDIS